MVALRAAAALLPALLFGQGVVDVTRAPFRADPSGRRDSTRALQQAIDFARDQQMVAFFPSGTYRVSDTLQALRGPSARVWGGGRMLPCVLVGAAKRRPRILLAPRSPGFGDPKNTKPVIHFWAPGLEDPRVPQANVNFNQMLVGIDVVVGEGNPGAVGVKHPSAQGSGIQDSTIDVTHGHTGIQGGAGSGGSHAGITIVGGRIGLDLRDSQPAPTIAGITLTGQTEAAIICNTLQSLSAVGVKIISRARGPVVVGASPDSSPQRGQMCFIDSQIVFEKPGGTGFSSVRALYLNNVYAKNAAAVVKNPDGSELPGNPDGWLRVGEYAHGPKLPIFSGQHQLVSPVYVDGVRSTRDRAFEITKGHAPPATLQSRHLWGASHPNWQSPGAASVKDAPYLAQGDEQADDTAAIQRAIDENETVLLPKGHYRVTRTIRLRPNTRLVGIGQHLSVLMAREAGGDFADASRPRPVVETADDGNARTVLDSLGIFVPKEVPGALALNWRSGRESLLRSVMFMFNTLAPRVKPVPRNTPLVVISGHGGGRWYNFYAEFSSDMGPDYRHLLVDGTSEPLDFYQCNPEHARSDANMEIRNARNVSIYGLKGEGNFRILWVRDSDNVRVFGYGGNAAAFERTSLFRFERTPNFLVANAVDQPRLPGKGFGDYWAGRGVDPREWHMIIDSPEPGREIATEPLDRPVLYRRGNPSDAR